MNDTRLTDALHILIDLKDRLRDLEDDCDNSYQPAILYLTSANLPGTDILCERLQSATSAIQDLREILDGVTYAGPDEGAFLYWQFEVKDGRTQEQAMAAITSEFSGQELQDVLLLYRTYKTKLPTLPESEKPTLRIHRTNEEERS